jgi:hypothetical protein
MQQAAGMTRTHCVVVFGLGVLASSLCGNDAAVSPLVVGTSLGASSSVVYAMREEERRSCCSCGNSKPPITGVRPPPS